jgi:hypothetical protein
LPDSRNLTDLNPYYQPIVTEVLRRANASGLYPFITASLRPYALQACYYAQGRLKPGESDVYQGYTVIVSRHDSVVIAKCGNECVRVPAADWSHRITNAQPKQSWHTLGFAADFAFRSSALSRDARYDLALYRKLAAIFREVCPDVRWGNDWDGDGLEVANDPDEHLCDLPHFEWHPGLTIGEAAAGELPAHQKQCHECGNFRDEVRNERCADCKRKASGAQSVGVK